jgi:tRNA wybutosine-synthesizing protein 2
MRARRIPREDLKTIGGADWVDRSRGTYVEGDDAWVPVLPGEPYDCELGERVPYAGRGYYMVGDIAVIHGEKPAPEAIEAINRFRHPRGIVWIEDLQDLTRTPKTELLSGTAGEVCHKESGYRYLLDPRKVMFSMGNREEKMRIAALVRDGPGTGRVADMFAGIGYFTIPLAGAGCRVHAMEINPVAFAYLERNICGNGLSGKVDAALGDCRGLLAGTYDRIVMGHFDAIALLPAALGHARAGSTIHLHSIGPVVDRIRQCAEGAGFSASIRVHKVKKYRPHAWHVVQDVTLA